MERRQSGVSPYRGADRRHQYEDDSVQAAHTNTVALGVGTSIALLAVLSAVIITREDTARVGTLQDTLRLARAFLFTVAGLMWMLRAHVTGRIRPAFVGAAFLVLGVFMSMLVTSLPLLQTVAEAAVPERLARSTAALAAAVLILAARQAPAVDARLRPAHLLFVVMVAIPALGWAVALLTPTDLSRAQTAASTGLVAAVWAVLMVSECKTSTQGRTPWLIWMSGYLAAASLLSTLALWYGPVVDILARGLAVSAAAVAARAAWAVLHVTLGARSQRLLHLSVDVHEREQRERSDHELQEERLHEVRNVLAGLLGATSTLRKYEDKIEPAVRRRLEGAISGELARLAELVDPTTASITCDVDLDEALGAVMVRERQQGALIVANLHKAVVRGNPTDIATIACALLVNARRHATGSPVLVRAERGDAETRIWFEDRGPGIPLEVRHSIFERGVRADEHEPGQGLGLYTARRLAEQMGGTLDVRERIGGGSSFVLTLPSSSVFESSGIEPVVPQPRRVTTFSDALTQGTTVVSDHVRPVGDRPVETSTG